VNVRGFNHPLGDCSITFFAARELAKKLRNNFPHSLTGTPLLIPGEMTVVRSRLLDWLDGLHIHPKIVGEFDDSALMKAFGRAGAGVFVAPTPIAEEVEKQYEVMAIGEAEEVRDYFYAISVERKISHPAVTAITEAAREWLVTDAPGQSKKRTNRKRG
jgi:LysR family transcriptional activator of nhaA